MSFSTEVQRSNLITPRVLVQLDISQLNTQWVNIGSGIWYVDFLALYPEVGPELLQGFTAQTNFGEIGSVLVDVTEYTQVNSLALLTTTETSFYYSNHKLYVHLVNYDEPILHTIFLGVIYGYSYSEFTPIGSTTHYAARLSSDIQTTESRDTLFFGKIQFNTCTINLINSDGAFDLFSLNNIFYGNTIRVLFGFDNLDISEYQLLFSATVESVTVSENEFTISTADKRKSLSKSVSYYCTNKNALEAIRELLLTHYSINYSSVFYDTVEWAQAEAICGNVTIQEDDASVISIIEKICVSVFGLFMILPDGKYTFRIIDDSINPINEITAVDSLNPNEITYNPQEVVSSTKIIYGVDSEYIDQTQEASIYKIYRIYNQKEFQTYLAALSDAQVFSTNILDYTKDVHGVGKITVPIKFYTIEVGDIIGIELNRIARPMLGWVKCEIIGKSYSLAKNTIDFTYRIVDASAMPTKRITEYGDFRITEDGDFRIIEDSPYIEIIIE